MEKNVRENLLLDFYEGVLTSKQKEIMEMYLNYDISLSEIADQLGMTRQAVYDAVKNASSQLEEHEQKLKIVQSYLTRQELLKECLSDVESLIKENPNLKKLQKIEKNIEKLLQN